MTLEEADKKIEFILQMQAQFEAGMGKLRDSQAALTVSVAEIALVLRESVRITDERFTRLADAQQSADNRMSRFDDQMTRLADSQRAADGRLIHLDSIVREIAEAGKATDERLNALIHVVERHITGPDHSPQSP